VPKETSFWMKISVLVLLVVSMLILAQGAMIGYAYRQGIKLSDDDGILGLLSDPNHSPISKLLIGLNHFLAFVLAPIIWVRFYYTAEIKEYFNWKQFNARYFFLFLTVLLSMYPLMAYAGELLDKLPFPQWLKGMDTSSMEGLASLLEMKYISDLLINIVIIGILPGLGEELLFRGVIQNELQKKWLNPHIAIWLSAFLFAILHFQVSGFPAKLLIGATLGYAYWLSGSLILSVILHALNNSLATISLYFMGGELNLSDKTNNNIEEIPIMVVLVMTMICIFVVRTIINFHRSQQLHE
jgi:membrane protease YdiL (CAAX protease family)